MFAYMYRWLFATVLACSKNPPPAPTTLPTPTPAEPRRSDAAAKALAELERLTTQMCACRDADCADRVFLAESAERQRLHDALDSGSPDHDEINKLLRLENQMTACMDKASGRAPEAAP